MFLLSSNVHNWISCHHSFWITTQSMVVLKYEQMLWYILFPSTGGDYFSPGSVGWTQGLIFVKSGNDGCPLPGLRSWRLRLPLWLLLSALSFWEQSATRSSGHSKSPQERLGVSCWQHVSRVRTQRLTSWLQSHQSPNLDHLATPLSDSWPTGLLDKSC